jgi:hypothetical protein
MNAANQFAPTITANTELRNVPAIITYQNAPRGQ